MIYVNNLIIKIQELRERLDELILNKKNLHDSEIMTTSKQLDELLNQYKNVLPPHNEKLINILHYKSLPL